MQIHQMEENSLNKMIIDTMQSKIKDQDTMMETLAKQIHQKRTDTSMGLPQLNQIMQDNQQVVRNTIQGLDDKIADTVHHKMLELMQNSDMLKFGQREKMLRDLIDAQGKDIAMDMSKIENDMLLI